MSNERLEVLGGLPLFEPLSPDERERLAVPSRFPAYCLPLERDAPAARALPLRPVCEPLEVRAREEAVAGTAWRPRLAAPASRRADWLRTRSRRWSAVALAARSTRRPRDPLEFGFAVFGIPAIVLVHIKLCGRTRNGTLPHS